MTPLRFALKSTIAASAEEIMRSSRFELEETKAAKLIHWLSKPLIRKLTGAITQMPPEVFSLHADGLEAPPSLAHGSVIPSGVGEIANEMRKASADE